MRNDDDYGGGDCQVVSCDSTKSYPVWVSKIGTEKGQEGPVMTETMMMISICTALVEKSCSWRIGAVTLPVDKQRTQTAKKPEGRLMVQSPTWKELSLDLPAKSWGKLREETTIPERWNAYSPPLSFFFLLLFKLLLRHLLGSCERTSYSCCDVCHGVWQFECHIK